MSVQDLETAVTGLSKEELAKFSQWVEEYLADEWDKQIERDAQAGKLDRLAEAVLAEFHTGEFTRLP